MVTMVTKYRLLELPTSTMYCPASLIVTFQMVREKSAHNKDKV
jgi:hypothetical protein